MLQAINDRIKGWLGAFVVALITLPFAFWGIQSYLGGGDENIAAKVNDTEITARDLEYGVSRQRQALAQRFGGKIPFDDQMLKKQVLEQKINYAALDEATFKAGYRISDDMLRDSIRQSFSRNGGFDRVLFESVLQSQGMSEQMFMQQMKSDLRVQQMQRAVAGTAIVTSEEVLRLAQLEQQTRDFSLIRFDVGSFSSEVKPTDEEIQNAYDSSPDRYMTPEKISVDYVELKGAVLSKEVIVDESQIKQMYDSYLASATKRESRKARHILLKVDNNKDEVTSQLEEIRQQIVDGASISDLARKYSQDPVSAENGGDLDWVEPGQMVKPFEDTLFALKKGEVSDVVETPFGLHLIKLDDIKSGDVKPLAEMRAEFLRDLTADQISSLFYDISETMAVAAYENPNSLGAVVDALNVETEIKTSGFFTRTSGSGIAQNEKIRRAAFSPAVFENGVNSDIIELAPDHIVVLRLNEHVPASLKPLDQVRPLIVASLKQQKGRQLALQAAQEARNKLEQGQDIKSVLGKGVTLENKTAIARTDNSVPAPVVDQVFSMQLVNNDKPRYNLVNAASGEIDLVRLNAVNTPEHIKQEELDKVKQQLQQRIAYNEIESIVSSIVDKAKVYRNPKILEE